MSESKTEKTSEADHDMLPLALIDPDPDNAREPTEEQVEQKAREMEAQGQLVAIEVRPKNGRYVVVFGHLRRLAALKLGWAFIKCVVKEGLTDLQAFQRQMLENRGRVNLTPWEEAKELKRLMVLSGTKSPAKLAALSHMKPGTVKNRLELGELPENVGRRVDRNGFSQAHAKFLAPLAEHEAVLNAVITRFVDGIEDVSKLDDFAREVVSYLIAQKLAITPQANAYQYQPMSFAEVRDLMGKHQAVKLKAGTEAFALVLDVDGFKAAAKARGNEIHVEEAAKRKADKDPEAPSKGETAAQKRKRLAEEAEREAERERRAALEAKANKLMGRGLAASVAKLDLAASSWVAAAWQLMSAREVEATVHLLAAALGLPPSKVAKLLEVDGSNLWNEGAVVVPKLWSEATEAQRQQILVGATALAALSYEGTDGLLADLTGMDEQAWHEEAEHPTRSKPEEQEAAPAEQGAPAEATTA